MCSRQSNTFSQFPKGSCKLWRTLEELLASLISFTTRPSLLRLPASRLKFFDKAKDLGYQPSSASKIVGSVFTLSTDRIIVNAFKFQVHDALQDEWSCSNITQVREMRGLSRTGLQGLQGRKSRYWRASGNDEILQCSVPKGRLATAQ